MNKHDHSKHLANSARIAAAVCALAALGGQAAQAQATFLTSFSQLTRPVKTNPYPQGTLVQPNPFLVQNGFTVAAGTVSNLTFTATKGTPDAGFQSNLANIAVAPQFSDPTLGGAAGDVLEDTSVTTASANTITGPLLIQFASPVTGFGLFAQDFNADFETFTLNVFADANATVSLGTFTYARTDNTSSAGTAVFVGAVSPIGLPLIRSATLSSFSEAAGLNPNNGSNDFFFGPAQVQAPVPEASTVVSFGMGLLLFGGVALVARRRKVGAAS